MLGEISKTFELAKEDIYNSERVIFGDFMMGIDVENRQYNQIVDLKELVSKVEEYLEDYNSTVKT
jgi:hypothetical protein